MLRSLGALVLAVCAAGAAAQENPDAVVPDAAGRDALYAWLDEVGYPDGVGLDAVSVTEFGRRELGFVLETAEDVSRVFVLHGKERQVPSEHATAEPAEFERAVQERLHELRRELESQEGPFHGHVWELSERARLALLARSASRRDLGALAADLIEEAARRAGVLEWPEERAGRPLAEMVRRDVEIFERVRTWNSASGAAADWRRRFLRYAELFPDTDYTERAQHNAAVLSRMSLEEQHIPTDEDLEALSGGELARALVLRIRTQATSYGAMGASALNLQGHGDWPADRLIRMGDAAVPALVDALGDDTLTRTVHDGRVGISPRVATVGEAARHALHQITRQWFGTAEEARAWLARRGSAGEAQLLRDQVLREGWIDQQVAKRLIELDPAMATEVLIEGLESREKWSERITLVGLLATIDTPEAAARLREEMGEDRPASVRVAAAELLLERNPEDAQQVLAAVWRSANGPKPIRYPAAQAVAEESDSQRYAWERVTALLVRRREYDVLAEGFADHSAFVRVLVLRDLVASAPGLLESESPGTAERLVLAGLRDEAARSSGVFSDNLDRCADARICDVVAGGLAARFGARFAFNGAAPREVRDARRARMRNAFRKRTGEAPLPEPPLPTVEYATADVVAPLLAAFGAHDLRSLDAAERRAAEAGLGVLSALRAASLVGRFDGAGAVALGRAVRRVSCTVRDVIVREGADERAVAAVRELVGGPLDAGRATAALRALLEDGVGVEFLAHRAGDGTGCTLVVAPGPRGGRYRMALRGVANEGGSTKLNDKCWRMIEDELRKAVALDAETPFAIHVRLRP